MGEGQEHEILLEQTVQETKEGIKKCRGKLKDSKSNTDMYIE